MDSPKPKKQITDWGEAARIFVRLSAWIAGPVLLGVVIGKWLDYKYSSSPKWFLIVMGLSFIISMVGLVKNTLSEYKKIEADTKNTKINSTKVEKDDNEDDEILDDETLEHDDY